MPGAATDNPHDESRPGAVHASWGWCASSRARARGPALARARLVPPPPRHPRPALDARGRHRRLRRRAAIRGVSHPLRGGRGRRHGRAGGRSAGPAPTPQRDRLLRPDDVVGAARAPLRRLHRVPLPFLRDGRTAGPLSGLDDLHPRHRVRRRAPRRGRRPRSAVRVQPRGRVGPSLAVGRDPRRLHPGHERRHADDVAGDRDRQRADRARPRLRGRRGRRRRSAGPDDVRQRRGGSDAALLRGRSDWPPARRGDPPSTRSRRGSLSALRQHERRSSAGRGRGLLQERGWPGVPRRVCQQPDPRTWQRRGRRRRLQGRQPATHTQAALQESEARLRQSQKMDAIGQLAGGIAHDFSNLLTVIIGRGELLRGRLTSSSDRETVSLITETAERASILTRQLLAFSRKQVLEPRVLDLGEVVAGMASMLGRLIGEHISFITAIDPNGTPVWGDVAQLEQVILNLAVNARDAMPTGGSLRVAVDTVLGPEPQVILTVRDTGCGMDAATQSRIFEPFFTTKTAGKGTGLGLATVYGIVQQHGGTVGVESAPGRGATFRVVFPRCAIQRPAFVADSSKPGASGRETILLVEDEEMLRAVAADSLRVNHYTVLEASSAEDALRLVAVTPARIDLLLTDVVMPGLIGPELADRLRRVRPGLRVLYMSGYPGDGTIGSDDTFIELKPLLVKPFSVGELMTAVRSALESGKSSLTAV